MTTAIPPSDEERDRFDAGDSDYEAQLHELDETLKIRHELATQQYDEDERNIDEGWPYPDEDKE